MNIKIKFLRLNATTLVEAKIVLDDIVLQRKKSTTTKSCAFILIVEVMLKSNACKAFLRSKIELYT